TSGIEQINQAITQMDQVTQQNAALVEEAAAAAASLQEQAGSLVDAVSIFRLGGDDESLTRITPMPAVRRQVPRSRAGGPTVQRGKKARTVSA
ncbi:hypothetical protein QTI04_25785, partial [Variovorax sp. J22R115]|nr:hypothetical protein [Variovorax sp. J22R115]